MARGILLLVLLLSFSFTSFNPLHNYYWNKLIESYFKEFLSRSHLVFVAKLSDEIFLYYHNLKLK
jgi:hypothetical protein